MLFKEKRDSFFRHIVHLKAIKHYKGHGIHSPFAFSFVQKIYRHKSLTIKEIVSTYYTDFEISSVNSYEEFMTFFEDINKKEKCDNICVFVSNLNKIEFNKIYTYIRTIETAISFDFNYGVAVFVKKGFMNNYFKIKVKKVRL